MFDSYIHFVRDKYRSKDFIPLHAPVFLATKGNMLLIHSNLRLFQVLVLMPTVSSKIWRPIWALMNRLPSFSHCRKGDLSQAKWLEERVVNLPSSAHPPARH